MADQVPTSGPDASVTIKVSNTAELQEALSHATDGSVIELAGGDYGSILLRDLSFSNGVEIRSADPDDPATFSSMSVLRVEGLHFDSLAVKFVPDADTMFYEQAVRITSSSNISFTNSTITGGPAVNGVDISADDLDSTGNVLGLPTARGIMVTNSTDIDISDNDISLFYKGIILSKVSGATITGNEIHDLRTTPLSGGGVSDVVVDGNYFHDSNPWNFGGDGDHGDMIHFWTIPGYDTDGADNITITNNLMDQGDGYAIMGVYLDDNHNGIGFTNVTIDNNVISTDNNQAIRLESVEGTITRNSLITDGDGSPGLLLRYGSVVYLEDNLGVLRTDDLSVHTGQSVFDGTGADASTVGLVSTGGSVDKPVDEVQEPAPQPVEEAPTESGQDQGSVDAPSSEPAPTPPLTSPLPGAGSLIEKTVNVGGSSVHDNGEASLLIGTEGDNAFRVTHEYTRIAEKADGGTDSVQSFVSYTLDAHVEDLTLKGDAQFGIGNALDNMIKGNDLANRLEGHDGNDTLFGYGGDDAIDGGSGNDRLFGGNGNDRIDGGDGNDTLFGESGNDLLLGGAGDDKIEGGAGSDHMFGGAGSDLFIFGAEDFAVNAPDLISDFSSAEGDRIGLNRIDANVATDANDKFAFVGTADFSGKAGELRYDVKDGSAHVSGDWDGDGVADFSIVLEGVTSLHSSDFML